MIESVTTQLLPTSHVLWLHWSNCAPKRKASSALKYRGVAAASQVQKFPEESSSSHPQPNTRPSQADVSRADRHHPPPPQPNIRPSQADVSKAEKPKLGTPCRTDPKKENLVNSESQPEKVQETLGVRTRHSPTTSKSQPGTHVPKQDSQALTERPPQKHHVRVTQLLKLFGCVLRLTHKLPQPIQRKLCFAQSFQYRSGAGQDSRPGNTSGFDSLAYRKTADRGKSRPGLSCRLGIWSSLAALLLGG